MQETSASTAKDSSEKDRAGLGTVARCLLITALLWYLLRELAGLLRPLLLAVFLCYIIVPAHVRLRHRFPGVLALVLMAGAVVIVIYLLVLMVYDGAVELHQDLPGLIVQAEGRFDQVREFLATRAPWLRGVLGDAATVEAYAKHTLREAASALVNAAANTLTEALVVGFYLLFLLLELGRFPERVRGAFATPRADQVLEVAGRINTAIAGYFRVKVRASLVLAVPAALVLWAFGIPSPVLWGVLTFFANFIPYLGSVVACSLPLAIAFLQLEPGWQPLVLAGLLISLHLLSAYLVEPAMTGKAVGLSPLVLLVALAFWGQCWGLMGMLLAVPLTVMLKIVLENMPFTRPLARLMGDD
jgi:predicted PurR-regulated permease PerM